MAADRRGRWGARLAWGAGVAVLGLLVAALLRPQPPGVRQAERASAWVLGPPRLAPAALPSPEPAGTGGVRGPAPRGLRVRVEDVRGGPIAAAIVSTRSLPRLGRTGEDGWLWVEAAAVPEVVGLTAEASGYDSASTVARVPGEVSIRLLPLARVSGRVVERGTDRPVAGVTVACGPNQAESRADGEFSFVGLEPGRHSLTATGEGWSGTLAAPFSLGPADEVSGLRIEVTRAFALSGTVSAAGRHLPELEVRVRAAAHRRQVTTEVDEAGRYRLPGLPPGTYEVDVGGASGALTFQPRVVAIVDRDVTVDIDLGARERIDFEVVDRAGKPIPWLDLHTSQERGQSRVAHGCRTSERGTCTVDGLLPGRLGYETRFGLEGSLMLPSPGPVRLVIDRLGTLRGRLRRADGRAVGDRYVTAQRKGGGGRANATSDDRDTFEMRHLPAGLYEVRVYLESVVSQDTPREVASEVQIHPGAVTEIELLVASATASLAGVVVDQSGRPVPDALVTYDVNRGHARDDGFVRGLALAATDHAGAFRFDDVLTHYRYQLIAYTRSAGVGVVEGAQAGGAPVTLRLEALADLTVEVSGFPAGRLQLTIERDGRPHRLTSGAAGTVYRFDNLRPGAVVVRGRADDVTGEVPVVLEAGRATTVRLVPR